MKKTSLLFLACFIAFNSCKKDKTNNQPTPEVTQPGISLKVNGVAKYFPPAKFTSANYMMTPFKRIGFSAATATEQISVTSYAFAPGTYKMDNTVSQLVSIGYTDLTFTNGGGGYFVLDGSVTITSVTDTHITGTFQFNGINITNIKTPITDGKFDCDLVKVYQ